MGEGDNCAAVLGDGFPQVFQIQFSGGASVSSLAVSSHWNMINPNRRHLGRVSVAFIQKTNALFQMGDDDDGWDEVGSCAYGKTDKI